MDWVHEEFRKLGYVVYQKTLEAAAYGVPQNRQRVFFVGFRKEEDYLFPKPLHGAKLRPFTNVRKALENVPTDEPNTARVTYAQKPVLQA